MQPGDSARAQPPDYSYDAYASDLAALIEKLDLRNVVLVGHSTGGLLAYAAASQCEEEGLAPVAVVMIDT